MSKRSSWNEYFMSLAEQVSTRATCDRKHVGCVLVKDNQIIATGYNGSPSGAPHCDDEGHYMVEGHCIRTIHAETNAILQAAKHGVAVQGATAYVTTLPCVFCIKSIRNAGIKEVYFRDLYREEESLVGYEGVLGKHLDKNSLSPGVFYQIPFEFIVRQFST